MSSPAGRWWQMVASMISYSIAIAFLSALGLLAFASIRLQDANSEDITVLLYRTMEWVHEVQRT